MVKLTLCLILCASLVFSLPTPSEESVETLKKQENEPETQETESQNQEAKKPIQVERLNREWRILTAEILSLVQNLG